MASKKKTTTKTTTKTVTPESQAEPIIEEVESQVQSIAEEGGVTPEEPGIEKIEFTDAFKNLYNSFLTVNSVYDTLNNEILYETEPEINGILNKKYTRNREDIYAVYGSLYNKEKNRYNNIIFFCNKNTLFDRFRIFNKQGYEFVYYPNNTIITEQLSLMNEKNNLVKVYYSSQELMAIKTKDPSNTFGFEQMQSFKLTSVKIYPKYIWVDMFKNL